jgi:hypothetical protein
MNIMKNRAVPFIETMGTEKFKQFLGQQFSVNMLYAVLHNKPNDVLFEGWRGKDMGTWQKFTNEDGTVLEFYPNQYIVVLPKNKGNHTILLPKTLNDFINDMKKFEIQLYWGGWMDVNFEPKEYLHKDDIEYYFRDLLYRLGKSHELL